MTALVLKQDAKASMFVCGMTAGFYEKLFLVMQVLAPPLSLFGTETSWTPDHIKLLVPKNATHAAVIRIGKEATLDLTFSSPTAILQRP